MCFGFSAFPFHTDFIHGELKDKDQRTSIKN